MRPMRHIQLGLFALSLVFVCSQPIKADDVIRIGIIAATFGYAPVFVAKEKGFFKREGLYPEIVIISRNEQIVQALISDSLQFGNVPPNLLPTPSTFTWPPDLILGSPNATPSAS